MCTGPHAFIPAPDTARLEIVVSALGQTMENVFYFQRDGGWNADTLAGLAGTAFAAWDDHVAPMTSNAVEVIALRATDVSVDDGAGVEVSGAGHHGTDSASTIAPLNVTVATKFATGLTGRSNRGRVFNIGLTKGNTAGNQLATGVAAAIASAWAQFFAQIHTELPAVSHVVVSYCHNGAWRTTAVVNPVLSYTTNPDLDSMRRRLNGRGS